jgi:hypothetical protein
MVRLRSYVPLGAMYDRSRKRTTIRHWRQAPSAVVSVGNWGRSDRRSCRNVMTARLEFVPFS